MALIEAQNLMIPDCFATPDAKADDMPVVYDFMSRQGDTPERGDIMLMLAPSRMPLSE